MRSLFLSLVALFALAACERKLPTSMQAHVPAVDTALSWLLALPPADDNWVIFTDKESQLFVQFEVVQDNLVVEVPLIGRSDRQVQGLDKVFSRAGCDGPTLVTAKDSKTLKAFQMKAYRMSFGRDPLRAATFAVRVFHEAYGLSALNIEIERNAANQALLPTPTAVTAPAGQEPRQP